ncbi:MAG: hypothetical protein H6926_06825 [Chromatiales bacterium]|nr:hypothetical protein [Gammaproteobacteria bacterium]MCP5230621.1 hypothetical protein [Zoogloeaceae bacterium]MCP5352882.1 hypothetical protein [Chromatiales bacterium]
MAGIVIIRVGIGLEVRVEEADLLGQVGEICEFIGPNLARQIDRACQADRLGYYPALDYFEDHMQVDADLLASAKHLYEIVAELVRAEVTRRLRPAFSNVFCEHIQSVALTLPRVRPGQPTSIGTLARHLTPDRFRLDLLVSNIVREGRIGGIDTQSRQKVERWLKDHFAEVNVSSARVV